MNNLLGRHRTDLGVSRASIASCAEINTKVAFKKLFQDLYQIGVRGEMIKEREKEILNIFQPPNATTSGLIDASNNADQSELQPNTVVGGQVDVSTIIHQNQLQAVRNVFWCWNFTLIIIEN